MSINFFYVKSSLSVLSIGRVFKKKLQLRQINKRHKCRSVILSLTVFHISVNPDMGRSIDRRQKDLARINCIGEHSSSLVRLFSPRHLMWCTGQPAGY